MKTKIVASSFIKRITDDLYLMVRRSDTDPSRKGEWDLAGGTVDEGETIRQGVLREVAEEVGLKEIVSCDLRYAVSRIAYSESEKQDVNYIFLFHVVLVDGEEEVVLSYEHDKYEWVTSEVLADSLTHKAQKAAYDHIFNNTLI